MDLNATLDIIIKDLLETVEIIDDLKRYPGVPLLQIELAKSKCKSAGEVIALLKNIPEPIYKGKEDIPQKHDEPKTNPAIDNMLKEIEKPDVGEPLIEVEDEPGTPDKNLPESAIIADQFSNLTESFNQTLGTLKHEDDISEILKTKPVSSLTEAIGINDKFLFIREIFQGDQNVYSDAITRLNSAGTLVRAKEILAGYTGENVENEAAKQLMDLIKRKFPSYE